MTVRKLPTEVSEAINSMSYRIEKTESDFLGHLQKVENKLEQIADLTRTVAVLQQQTNQQTEQLVETRTQVRDLGQKIESSLTRIHGRIDESAAHARDRTEIASKELEIKLKSVETKSDSTEKELKQWLNRGIGAWVILALAMSLIQTAFYRWTSSLENDRQKSETQLSASAATIEKHNQQLDQLVTMSKEQQQTNKRLEQLISDMDRRIDTIHGPQQAPYQPQYQQPTGRHR